MLIILMFTQISPTQIAWVFFIFNCIIEFSQLWQPPFLEAIRATLFGHLFLGSGFSWAAFIGSILGCNLGEVLVVGLKVKFS